MLNQESSGQTKTNCHPVCGETLVYVILVSSLDVFGQVQSLKTMLEKKTKLWLSVNHHYQTLLCVRHCLHRALQFI
jgi:hypothetical protein